MNAPAAPRIRSISLFTATCIVVANMIGVGVFTSLGSQVGGLPSGFAIMALWVLGGLTALCGALVYGELAAALPRSGGEYHLLSAALHPVFGFLAGWISITVGFSAPVALAAMAFGKYFGSVLGGLGPVPLSLIIVALITLVHLYGTRVGGAFQNIATTLKVILIVTLIGAGLLMTHPQPISFLPQAGDWKLITSTPFAISLYYVMYSYSGWNATAYIVGEVKNPGRNVPASVAIGTLLVTVLYVLLNGVFLRAAPLGELAGKLEVGHVAATHIFGAGGGRLMAGLISLGLVSSISAMTWIGPRVSVAMGQDWQLLRFLAWKTRGGVPAVAIVAQSAIVFLLLLTASFDAVLKYIQFSLTICSFLTVASVFVLRWRRPDLARPCRTWGYPVTPLLFLAVNVWLLWFTLQGARVESLAGLATMLLGLAVYLLSRDKKRRSDFEEEREVPPESLVTEKIAL